MITIAITKYAIASYYEMDFLEVSTSGAGLSGNDTKKAVLFTSTNANYTYLAANCYLILDVDECAIKTDNCSLNATCKNTEGSFDCSCIPGYVGNGTSCAGIYNIAE